MSEPDSQYTSEAETLRTALSELLEAVMGCDAFPELEAGCCGDGPVVRAHLVLGLPFPEELKRYLTDGDCPVCEGNGYNPDEDDGSPCPMCDGTGKEGGERLETVNAR